MENSEDRSRFIENLDYFSIVYRIDGEKIIIGNTSTIFDHVNLDDSRVTSIPDNVIFINEGNLWLNKVTKIGENVSFENDGFINLESLSSDLPASTQFKNRGWISLRNLTKLNPGTKFENSKGVYLLSIKSDDVPDDVSFLNRGTISFRDFNSNELENEDEAFVLPNIRRGMLMNLMRKRNLLHQPG
jgi:hypothetical protein